MTAIEIVIALRRLGVQASTAGERLTLRGPSGFLTAELRRAIDAHRAELLRLLRPTAPLVAAPSPRACGRTLSSMERQLWFEQQLYPGAIHYNVPVAIRLGRGVATAAVEQALGWIVRRHPALRARFPVRADAPIVDIAPAESAFGFAVVDLPVASGDAAVHDALLEFVRRPFDLARDAPFRACLLRGADGVRTLAISVHHIVADGWSMGILLRDFERAYAALVSGTALPEAQHPSDAPWRLEPSGAVANPPALDALTEAAVARLSGIPELALPYDFRRPTSASHRGGIRGAFVPRGDLEQLAAVARTCGSTLFNLFSAAFMVMLYHECRQDHLAIGTDVAGRDDGTTDAVVGCFVNQIVMAADLSGNPSLHEIVGRAATAFHEASAIRELPFDLLTKAMRERTGGRGPLFRAKIVMQPPLGPIARTSDFEMLPIHNGTCKFDLLLNVWVSADGAGVAVEYSHDVFADETGERFLQHTVSVLQAAASGDPSLRLADLDDRLSIAERARRPQSSLAHFVSTMSALAP